MVVLLHFFTKMLCCIIAKLAIILDSVMSYNLQLSLGAISTPICYENIMRDHEFPIQFSRVSYPRVIRSYFPPITQFFVAFCMNITLKSREMAILDFYNLDFSGENAPGPPRGQQ